MSHLQHSIYIPNVHLQDNTPLSTLVAPSSLLPKLDGDAFANKTLNRSTMRALQYVTLIKLEISFFVNKLSQFLSTPTTVHLQAFKKSPQISKGIIKYGLKFHASSFLMLIVLVIVIERAIEMTRNQLHVVCVLVKKQAMVSRSSTKLEYRALNMAALEVLLMRSLVAAISVSFDYVLVL